LNGENKKLLVGSFAEGVIFSFKTSGGSIYLTKKRIRMKKLLFIFCICFVFTTNTHAQRYAVIDSKYILSKLPEYKDAQDKLDQFSKMWQQEIDQKSADLNKMYKDYDAEKIMLSDELKKKREDEIYNKEKELRDLQRQRFGYQGDLFKKREELVKPIQDKVYNAIQKLAVAKLYDFILDKSEGITVIFADPKLDKSDDVLRELGVK
jgi:outer membrane protein